MPHIGKSFIFFINYDKKHRNEFDKADLVLQARMHTKDLQTDLQRILALVIKHSQTHQHNNTEPRCLRYAGTLIVEYILEEHVLLDDIKEDTHKHLREQGDELEEETSFRQFAKLRPYKQGGRDTRKLETGLTLSL